MNCFICNQDFPRAGTGREARYCSPAHKQLAYRKRKQSVTKLDNVTKPVTKPEALSVTKEPISMRGGSLGIKNGQCVRHKLKNCALCL